ncbi:MAG: 2'-5' RNA ligase family protein [Hydrogenophaga sp.]|jgi:2'-5' RNA ligase|nr:2'-5' RNA ligase family protein [Hydrogenophaga sp.]
MNDQFNLPGFDPPTGGPVPSGQHNLFFALMPPVAVAEQVMALAGRLRGVLGLTGRLIDRDRLHVSLLGVAPDVSPPIVEAARVLAARVNSAPFDVVFDRVLSFDRGMDRSQPLVLCHSDHRSLHGLHLLQQMLGLEMKRAGCPVPAGRSFNPHMTLLYDHRLVAEQIIDAPLHWTATEFALIESHVGHSHYECLGTWPLRP